MVTTLITSTTLTVSVSQQFFFIEKYVAGTVLSAFVRIFFYFIPTIPCIVLLFLISHGETKVKKSFVTCLVKLGFNELYYWLSCYSAFLFSFSLIMMMMTNIS